MVVLRHAHDGVTEPVDDPGSQRFVVAQDEIGWGIP